MKKLITTLVLVILMASQTVIAQSWTQQTSNTDSTLWGVCFLNNDTGFVAGNHGTILKTIDGGANWSTLNSGTTYDLGGLWFVDDNIGYVASWFNEGGIIFKTTNGGNNWNNISLNMSDTHCGGMWFFSADSGLLAIGDNNFDNSKILKTSNGGDTWDTVYSEINGWLSFFYFPDADNGYATVSNGQVLKTTDGGNSWIVLDVGAPDLFMSGVYFFDKDTGFIGGGSMSPPGGSLFKTTDGGNTWQNISNGIGVSIILFTTTNIGYIVGMDSTTNWSNKVILKTTNGGIDWVLDPTPGGSLNSISFPSINVGYAVGDNGTILKYEDITGTNDKLLNLNNKVTVYPNPFTTSAILKISDNIQINSAELSIYNTHGREVCKITNITNNEVELNRKGLNSGLYFYSLSEKNNIIKTGKFIVK